MDKEYVITGTPDELKEIIESNFKLTSDEARFMTTILISQSFNEEAVDMQDEMTLWYLDKSAGENRTPIFNSRHSISFTDFGIEFIKKVFISIGTYMFDKEHIGAAFILECVIALYESYHYISDMECCVYFTAIKWKKEHGEQLFTVNDIMSELKGKCIHLDRTWNCVFQSDDNCRISEENIQEILSSLCKHNVLVQQGRFYDFTK